jgi:hypothetical protein
MILGWIVSMFIGIFEKLISLLPTIDAPVPIQIAVQIVDIIADLNVVFPVPDFIAIMGISFALINWHMAWKLIQRVWDALPFT